MHRQAVLLRPLRHLDHSNWLNSLASALMIQFEHIGGIASLAEAVDLLRQTLDLRLPRSPARRNSLSNLANALYVRFQELGDWESLMEAINLHAQALKLLPLGHPDRSSALSDLANALRSRGHLHGALNDNKAALNDVTAAISLHRQALELRPLGHSNRPKSLGNLAAALQATSTRLATWIRSQRRSIYTAVPWNFLRILVLTAQEAWRTSGPRSTPVS
jgi:hypothetical protein